MKLGDKSFSASFLVKGSDQWIPAEVNLKPPVHPFGRCKALKPPQGVPYKSVESLSITLLERKTIKVILRDLNSVWLYPTAFQTRGDKMELSFGAKNASVYKQYKAKMSWTHHVEGDPLFQCRKYEANFTLNDCIRDELHKLFLKELSCIPPLFTENRVIMCQKRFNLSPKEDNRIKRMFWRIYEKYKPLNCPSPCSKIMVETQLMHEDSFPTPTLDLIFDPEVEVSWPDFPLCLPSPSLQ